MIFVTDLSSDPNQVRQCIAFIYQLVFLVFQLHEVVGGLSSYQQLKSLLFISTLTMPPNEIPCGYSILESPTLAGTFSH